MLDCSGSVEKRPPTSSAGGFQSASQIYGKQDRTNVGHEEMHPVTWPPLPLWLFLLACTES